MAAFGPARRNLNVSYQKRELEDEEGGPGGGDGDAIGTDSSRLAQRQSQRHLWVSPAFDEPTMTPPPAGTACAGTASDEGRYGQIQGNQLEVEENMIFH